MTKKRFYCEQMRSRFLQIYILEKELKLISIYIENENDEDYISSVDLTIQDAIELIEELNKEVLKLKGGKNA